VRDLPKGAAEIPAAVKKEKWSRIGVNTTEDFEPLYIIPKDKKKDYVIKSANKFLTKRFLPSGYCPHTWKIKGIDSDGNLRIQNKTQIKVIKRF
ncbi:hypothetical protein OA006_01965, partial [Prochlorococcus sp. AH-736-D21]|nr:hypothetical protein [Prochlorococcus sp. AH-736-D21]